MFWYILILIFPDLEANNKMELKENYELNYSEIGRLLERDPRTVWTCYNRSGEKLRGKKRGR